MDSTLPFFENVKIHKGKNLNDKQVALDLKKDLDQLIFNINNLPFLAKSYLKFTNTNIYIINSKKIIENIISNGNTDHNIKELKKNISSLMVTLSKNKQFDSYLKNYLGKDYLSNFKIVSEIVNNS